MEVHEDVPEYFEIALTYLYTDVYDTPAVTRLAAQNDEKRVRIPIGLFVVADKYGIDRLAKLAMKDMQVTLDKERPNATRDTVVQAAIQECYENLPIPDTSLGKCLSEAIIAHHNTFISSEQGKKPIRQYPVFATDLALNLHDRGTFGFRKTEYRSTAGYYGVF